jgi:hypothetical protein
MQDLANNQGTCVGFNDQNTIELALQHQISEQLLSPMSNRRIDSMFSSSSIGGTPRHSISHQAEAQPHANGHQNPHSPNGYSQIPVSGIMSRSNSQYSSASSGQRPHLHDLQRPSRSSFGSTMVTTGSDMTRSISSTSASQRTAPQPYLFQSHSQAAHFRTRRSSDLSPDMGYEQFSANTMNPFDYSISGTIDDDRTGHEGQDKTFGQIGYHNE